MASARLKRVRELAEKVHGKVPYLCKLPFSVIGIIFAVATANILCWAGVGIVLVSLRFLFLLLSLLSKVVPARYMKG